MTDLVLDYLPYIDEADISDEQHQLCSELIRDELDKSPGSAPHPRLPQLAPSKLSPTLDDWIDHTGTHGPGTDPATYPRLDLARYADPFGASSTPDLRAAYVALAYTQARAENLALVAAHGRNAWLAGNGALDDALARVEASVREERAGVQLAAGARRAAQDSGRPTAEYLGARWRDGVRGTVQVNVAALELRRQHENGQRGP